jgi:riboflavin biosynthesis pyrimidine reductase
MDLNHEGEVFANLIIAANSATTLAEKSAPLRTPEDALRFHQIRKRARAILIGGNTYRNEPYHKTPLPLLVTSNKEKSITSQQLSISAQPPEALIKQGLKRFGAPILIEGGPRLLEPLIAGRIIDQLFITRVTISGDGNFWNDDLLTRNYLLDESEMIGKTVFEIWRPRT